LAQNTRINVVYHVQCRSDHRDAIFSPPAPLEVAKSGNFVIFSTSKRALSPECLEDEISEKTIQLRVSISIFVAGDALHAV
jgi:hypothetical protein